MTKPRTSTTRELFGILGSHPDASVLQSSWNAYFAENGIDAFMDKYATTEENLPERLSEMFHFDRRGYIVAPKLQEAIVPLLDDASAERVDTVWNDGGILHGYLLCTEGKNREKQMQSRLQLWL